MRHEFEYNDSKLSENKALSEPTDLHFLSRIFRLSQELYEHLAPDVQIAFSAEFLIDLITSTIMDKQESSALCPVCSLFLRQGISLRDHLQTHSKEKVIEALLKHNPSTADLDQLVDLTSNPTQDASLPNANHALGFDRTLEIVPKTSSFVEPGGDQVSRTTPSILSCINNAQFPTLANNVIGQPRVSNAYTYQQFLTNEGNIVFIPVYNVGSTIVPNMVTNSTVNQCMVVPSNPMQSPNVIDPTSTSNVFAPSVRGPRDPDIHVQSTANSIAGSDAEEKKTDDEVANIFDQTSHNGCSEPSVDIKDDKSSYPSTTPSAASLPDDLQGNADEYVELDGNELTPSAAVSVIRVRSNLNFESSPFQLEVTDKDKAASDYTNKPSATSPIKQDPVSLPSVSADNCDKCDDLAIDGDTNAGILEPRSHPLEYDFVVSNSDNAILPDSKDESLDCVGRRNDQYILPNDEIPRNFSTKSDYNFLGVRISFLSSTSLISSVDKTMFADGDRLDFKLEESSVIVKDDQENTVETDGSAGHNVESAGSSRISPFDIRTDESMPPRGEISGQESLSGTDCEFQMQSRSDSFKMTLAHENPDMKTELQKIINDKNGAKESTSFNNNEKLIHKTEFSNETLCSNGSSPKKTVKRQFICSYCRVKFDSWKLRQSHVAQTHADEDGLTIESLFGQRVLCKAETLKTEEHNLPAAEDGATGSSYIECRICGDTFHTGVALLQHLRTAHAIRKRSCVCPTCFVRFAAAADYRLHIRQVHPYECPTCGHKFHTPAGYTLHRKRHLRLKPYSCADCAKSFVTKQKLAEHVTVHTGDRPIACELCDRRFKRHSNYRRHRKYRHLRRRRHDLVRECGMVLRSRAKLPGRRQLHEQRPKRCPFCVQRFAHAASLTRHVRRWHRRSYVDEGAGRRRVQGPVCGLRTSLPAHLRSHDDAKPFACAECARRFRTKWSLQLHRWTHAAPSAKPYKCRLCANAYVRKTDYEAHVRSHANARPYACDVCGRQFIRKYNCARHVREHQEPRAHQCAVCGKRFARSYYLSEHRKVHTGEKPHVCHVCGKASATKSNHNKHVKMHDVVRESVNTES